MGGSVLAELHALMRLRSVCRSYQDQLRQRVSANSLKPVNYLDESRFLIAQIEKLGVSA